MTPKHILRMVALSTITFSATTAHAGDTCADLWLARNSIFHAAGYCFSSTLGKAVFANHGCTGNLVLTPDAKKRVVTIKAAERVEQCRINSNLATLAVQNLKLRMKLKLQPIAEPYESSCIGYKGSRIALRDQPSRSAKIIGYIEPGNHVGFEHRAEGRWQFATTTDSDSNRGDANDALGWFDQHVEPCEDYAG